MRKYILTSALTVFLIWNASAQFQVGMGINSFYHKAPEIHNLAMLPLHPVPSVTLIAGSSMDGFKRHPVSATLLCSGFLIDKLGAGLKVNYEQQGLSSKIDIQLGLTYYVFINKKSSDEGADKAGDKFSFSLSGHFIQDRLKTDDISVLDPNDPDLFDVSNTSPNGDASAGIAFLRENKYYAGISAYQLIGTKSTFMNSQWKNARKRHYYLMGSYTFNLDKKNSLDLELHCIAAAIEFSAYQWEAGTDFMFLKMFNIGAGYQSNGALKFDLGIKAQSWDFGYAFSYGAWVDATSYTYKGFNNMIFIRKLFNEGRRSNK
jgi:type IX secretion system PorP/SprF family membrane protein